MLTSTKYFLRNIYNYIGNYLYFVYLQVYFWLDSEAAQRYSNECRPIKSNTDLLNFHKSPTLWQDLTQPIAARCSPVALGPNFLRMQPRDPETAVPESKRPKVMVCHDLAGNYRNDRFINGSKKWDDYRFYHWAGIDYFCYFSHEYITIPPLPWINAAHKNGVLILGTFIVEVPHIMAEVLQSEMYMQSVVEALVLVAKCCQFDGWFLNVECDVRSEKIPLLRMFIRNLTKRVHEEIPFGKVFWYDSVVASGKLLWQNELNERNIMFFNECDGIFINYTWNFHNLEKTARIVDGDEEAMARIYIGIDVFGRGQVAKYRTADTLSKIKNFNFSVGIFAPGWTFERVQDLGIDPWTENGTDVCNQHFIFRNNRFWSLLWQHFYSSGPKTLPFYTSFCLGSGKRKFSDGLETSPTSWFSLMEQEIQPLLPGRWSYDHHFEEAFKGGSCLKFSNDVFNQRLFVTDFSCDNGIVVAYAFKRSSHLIQMNCVLNVKEGRGRQYNAVCGGYSNESCYRREEGTSYKFYEPLRGQDLQAVVSGLSKRQERVFATGKPVNGWEIRYYQMKFESRKQARILDIGVSVTSDSWNMNDILLLGALHVQQDISQKCYYRNEDINLAAIEAIQFNSNQPTKILFHNNHNIYM